jgi:hypothetical protein
MAKKKNQNYSGDTIELNQEWIENIVDILQSELEIPVLGVEEKNTLERVIALSVGLYMMEMRESLNRTTKLTQ